jgi:3-oxoacyl-[acyl-carrier protein] reductase
MNSMKSEGIAVVTGGTGGLGSRMVAALCTQGFRVAVNYLQRDGRVDDLIRRFGDFVRPIKADVGDLRDVAQMAAGVAAVGERVTVLVNNAAITRDALLVSQEEADWDRVVKVNLKGPFNCIRAFAPCMKGGGHIVNISSYAGLKGKKGHSAYSASKAALMGLTRTAALELAPHNIRVNAVVPGYLPTTMGLAAKAALEVAVQDSALKRLSDPDDVVRFVMYLIATESVTGQVFCLDSRIL